VRKLYVNQLSPWLNSIHMQLPSCNNRIKICLTTEIHIQSTALFRGWDQTCKQLLSCVDCIKLDSPTEMSIQSYHDEKHTVQF
jgi:hypothetical protein